MKFQVNWPFGSGKEVKNIFSRWRPWWPSWSSNGNDFSYFWSTSHPDASYQVSSQFAICFRRRSEKQIFKMAVTCFDLQVTPMLPIKFQVNWPFGSGEEVKNIFSRWWQPSRILDRKDFSYFGLTSHPYASNQVSICPERLPHCMQQVPGLIQSYVDFPWLSWMHVRLVIRRLQVRPPPGWQHID